MVGKVYIVGAGPGDPELMTLKAYRLLKEADVILYDRLVGEEITKLLHSFGKTAIYVGKDGKGKDRQIEINNLMKTFAEEDKKVLRLKGGDPTVFGRLWEEIEFLRANKIPFEIIPGVSSVNGAPACANIPLTHPEFGKAIIVMGGREVGDYEETLRNSTLVVLMSGISASEISKNLIKSGFKEETKVAVIQKGSFKDQKVSVYTLGELAHSEKTFESPALMVVGEVVRFVEKYNCLEI
ncbi:MAG: uroporphyrinogen-III C-methyltransferase [Archaeoglobaceae archaeon]|nr:uroporphyrinogen-III C-methyltransferase [Archaeoglobaceae archaeon]MDW8118454.1 uroporphyrinogen-III C-methyltransferase [Archaeoglobaceae archaeon]